MLFDGTPFKKKTPKNNIFAYKVYVDLEVLSGDVLTLVPTWYLSKKVVFTLN